MRDKDRFRGCLIGGAAGDALGYAVEFMREDSIFARYGSGGISQYELTHGVAQISDDTQMTLFTANGLLFGTTRGMTRGIMAPYEDYIHAMYKCWYKTQQQGCPIKYEPTLSWLLNIKELYSRRAPGNTCLSALAYGDVGSISDPINTSKGCGGVMRVAPIGLYFCDRDNSFDHSDMLGAKAAALTHGHELGYIPAAALVHIIRAVCEKGMTLTDAVTESVSAAQRLFSGAKHIGGFVKLMNRAAELSQCAADDLDAIHELGEGWVAEETLAVAVYCALKYQSDFDTALRVSVNHNGDSDSTGAVTGNILGAYLGYDAIPQMYKTDLELHDVIIEIADDLCDDCRISEYGSGDDVWERKYISACYPNK